MNGISVIIPSRNAANLVPCVEAVRKCEPEATIIVIDDGVQWSEFTPDIPSWGRMEILDRFGILRGINPFIFARNVNLGIRAAGADDVVLLNDDAILETPGGFACMQQAARVFNCGLVSATTNLAGNPAQHRRGISGVRILDSNTPGNSFPTVAFVCVLILRYTIEVIGLLDERFTAYGWEDNDYCRRVHNAGLKIGIHDGCYVDHAKLHSTFRGDPTTGGKLEAGRKIYLDKWGSM